MSLRDTSVATEQAIKPGSKCHTGTQAWLSNKYLGLLRLTNMGIAMLFATGYYRGRSNSWLLFQTIKKRESINF